MILINRIITIDSLGKINHIVGKFIEDLVITVRISIRHIAQFYGVTTETEMVTLTLDGINDRSDFSETVTAYKLAEHHYKKLIPTGKVLHQLVSFILLKTLLGRKLTSWLNMYLPELSGHIAGGKNRTSVQI